MIENAEVPLKKLPDGRDFLADEDVRADLATAAFVQRFSNYWCRDELRCGWVSPRQESIAELWKE